MNRPDRPQTILTPGGETMVVLPLAEYDRLLDRADIGSAERIQAEVAAGHDEALPAELVKAIVAGAEPIGVWRRHRGLSGRALAAMAGISTAYLSELESGRKAGSLSVLRAIAEALRVDIGDLT